ncbi:MAG TPA: response regulator [Anaerolineales bacterium]|nr:response regulator [Anaerolineales bacterium]
MSASDILIAEDENSAAQELREQLEGLGYRVVDVASSSAEALYKTEKLRPQIVLMNIRLKGEKDGIQTGSLLHALHGTPVVYMIDYSNQATIRRVTATGPFGYIFRPFDEKQIVATIETALIRHKLERKLQQSRQWLNTTLTSIGDGVIATDDQGLVRFINPVAMELTGWHQKDAIGRSLYEIFLLVDESSHELVDLSHIQNKKPRAESRRGIVGLLMPRNGPPVPVEANATFIQNRNVQVYGMVLVFRDVTESREALQEIIRQANRAEILVQVASQFNAQLQLDTVLNTICEITNQTLKAAGTAVFLHDLKKGVFRDRAAISENPAIQPYQASRFEVPADVFQALLSRENPVVVIPDVQAYPELPYYELYEQFNVRTVVVAALFHGEYLRGAIISDFVQNQKFLPADDITLLRGLADQASNAIQNAELLEQVRAGRERQRSLAKSLVDVQEAERGHIAKELHDHLGQILTGIQFMLENAKNQAGDSQKANLEEIQNSVGDVIGQVRDMSLNLRPTMLDDMGLIPTLHWHIDRYISQTGIHVIFQYDEISERFPAEIESAAYRIVQEALTNVARHAKIKEAFVGLAVQEKTLWVEVLDKGKGFDASINVDKPTSGLGGMQERANLVGGYLTIRTFINQGTQILAAFPLTGKPLERRKHDRKHSAGR